ncbi:hypothetical protein Q5752_004516 [Cryptotrichosporon argae]
MNPHALHPDFSFLLLPPSPASPPHPASPHAPHPPHVSHAPTVPAAPTAQPQAIDTYLPFFSSPYPGLFDPPKPHAAHEVAPAPSAPAAAPATASATATTAAQVHEPGPNPQRSRNGCYTCRARKIKCDEQRPRCQKCAVGKRSCEWPPDDPLVRRKNRPRKPLLSLLPAPAAAATSAPAWPSASDFASAWSPAASSAGTPLKRPAPEHDAPAERKRTFRLAFHAPDSFVSSLAPVAPIRERDLIEQLVPDQRRAEMMMDPTFLHPYFPTLDEKLVMRHYLSRTVHIIQALETNHRPWNPWVSVHAPLAFTHLPGVSPAADALRAAILAVGAVHLRYLNDPMDQAGAWRITRVARPKVLDLVRRALEGPDGEPKSIGKEEVELVLAALLSCTIASSLAADDSWHSLLTSVLSLISRLGGAQSLLQDAPRDHLSPCRFVLEQLAIRDVFGCMTTELAPSILRDAFTPWFFEAEGWSRDAREWESVERMFGISRGMVDLIARACTLISRVKTTGYRITEHQAVSPRPSLNSLFHLRLPAHVSARSILQQAHASPRSPHASSPHAPSVVPAAATGSGSSRVPSRANPLVHAPAPDADDGERLELEAAANGLMAELKVWDQATNFTPFHPRTQFGNHAHKHAMRIRMLRNVFGAPGDDPRIATSARAILELAKEMLAQYQRIVWMTWPILLAGFHIPKDDPARQTAAELLGEFGPHACFDNRAACRMMTAFWAYHDQDENDLSPWEVAKRMDARPFLD